MSKPGDICADEQEAIALTLQIASLLQDGMRQATERGGRQEEARQTSFSTLAPFFQKSLQKVDEFFSLDCSFLLVRDVRQAEKVSIISATTLKDTLFGDELFPTGSDFVNELITHRIIRPEEFRRTRYEGDKLWELLWQSLDLGPYAFPRSFMTLALCRRDPCVDISDRELVGFLILIGAEGRMPTRETGAEGTLDLLAFQLESAVQFMRTLAQMEAEREWMSSEYLSKVATGSQRVVLHGVLAPLQRQELNIFLAEEDLEIAPRRDVQQRLRRIRSEAADVKRCVKSFFEMGSAVQDDVVDVHLESDLWVDTQRAILDALENYRALAERKSKTLVSRIHEIPRLPMKKDHFELIISNLLHNAIKYSYAGTKIKISYKLRGPDLLMDITSYGIQVPPEDYARIFLLGYRTPAASEIEYAAAGIGLYAARREAERYGGQLYVVASEREVERTNVTTYRNTFRFIMRTRQ